MLDILRQGIWASLSGGWYYDPHHRVFTNTFHLYLWLALFTIPLSLHLYFPVDAWYVWLVYAIVIGVTFTIIKLLNAGLHHLFDTGEVLEEAVEENSGKDGEAIGLSDLRREGTPPVSCSSRTSPRGGRRAINADNQGPSGSFPLRVDVHSDTQDIIVEREQLPVPDEVITVGEEREEGDVVILVDESPGANEGRRLEQKSKDGAEAGQSNINTLSFSSTASSQPTVSTNTTNAKSSRGMDTARRFSNLSNLASSLPNGPSSSVEPVAGSLDLAAILEPGYMDLVRQRQGGNSSAQVRRTKSALETGLVGGCNHPTNIQLQQASVEAGREGQDIRKEGVQVVEEEDSEQLPKGSDTDLASYQEQLEEATAALLRAGQYLEAETGKRQAQFRNSRDESKREEDKGSGLYLPMVGASSTDQDEQEDATAEEKRDPQTREGREEDRRETSLLSTVGLDWLFSDSEPEQPLGSPKPVEKSMLRSRLESVKLSPLIFRWPLFLRSESPKSGNSPQAVEGEPREPRDSSHGSSGTDTETRFVILTLEQSYEKFFRALLTKLETVESALEGAGGSISSGAIPKRKPHSRRLRQSGHR